MTRARPTHAEQILTDVQRAILAALRTGPKYGHELAAPDIGGIGFKERLRELRAKGYDIPHGKYDGPKRFVFRLIEDRPPLSAVDGGGERPDLAPAPALRAVGNRHPYGDYSACLASFVPLPSGGWRYNPGPFVVCTRCSYAFEEPGSSQACPMCKAGAWWLEEHHTDAARDWRASRVDPVEVDRQVQYQRRAIRDRERRVAA